jgi:alpha-tubulin suppressor-like RCC1 family protein
MRALRFTTALLTSLTALSLACGDSTNPSGDPGASAFAIGRQHVCQIRDTETTCWGRNYAGQLGTGDTVHADSRVAVAGNHRFTTATAGPLHTCAIDQDGVAWCWGDNAEATLGLGTIADEDCDGFPCQTQPVQVATGERFASVLAGDFFTCGLARSGRIFCWGLNEADQLGNDAADDDCNGLPCSRTPIEAAGGMEFTQLAAFRNGACGLDTHGSVRCWGIDVITHQHTSEPRYYAISRPFIEVVAGGNHVCALADDHSAWCWGIDALGAGATTLESDHPVAVAGSHHFSALAAAGFTTCGLEDSGVAWCWGPNTDGAVGREPIGASERFDEPARVMGDWRFTSLSGGYTNYCGVTTTGATVCWGRGNEGQLLNGGVTSAEPVGIDG